MMTEIRNLWSTDYPNLSWTYVLTRLLFRDGFNDFLNALAAFLPIGLFLAAIPPNIITINTS